jgi:hypothetical protein
MNKNSMYFVGLDLGDKFSYLTILDQEGELIEESRLPTTKASFQRRFSTLQPSRVAMEVGTHSRWASHLLTVMMFWSPTPVNYERSITTLARTTAQTPRPSPAWHASIPSCSHPFITALLRHRLI